MTRILMPALRGGRGTRRYFEASLCSLVGDGNDYLKECNLKKYEM
jgi:hypothetical protein